MGSIFISRYFGFVDLSKPRVEFQDLGETGEKIGGLVYAVRDFTTDFRDVHSAHEKIRGRYSPPVVLRPRQNIYPECPPDSFVQQETRLCDGLAVTLVEFLLHPQISLRNAIVLQGESPERVGDFAKELGLFQR